MAPPLPPPPPRPPTQGPVGHLSGRPARTYPASARWGLGDAWIALGVFIGSSLVAGIIALAFNDGSTLDPVWLPIVIAVPALSQAGYVVWVGRAKGRGISLDFGFRIRPSDVAIGAGLFVAGLFVAGFVGAAIDALFDITPDATVAELIEDSDEVGGGISAWIYLMAVLGATVIPVIEELVYRGLWWSALEKRGMREEWILVTTSVVFAALHLEPVRFPILLVLGLAFGYGRIRTGRIAPGIFAHIFVNSLAMVVLLASLS